MNQKIPPGAPRTLGTLIEEKATKLGDQQLLRFRDESYSYAEFNRTVNAIANEFHHQGVEEGDMVSVLLYNRPEFLLAIFALAKLGAVFVPIDTRYTGDYLRHIFSETESEVVILDEYTRSAYEDIRTDLTSINTEFFVGDTAGNHAYREFDQLLEGDESEPPTVEVDGADICSVNYVSRYSNGTPTGIMLPHYAYLHTAWEATQNILGLSSSDCIFTTQPFYGCYPIQVGVVGSIVIEGQFAFETQFQRDKFWKWIRTYDATVFLYLGRTLSVLHNQETNQTSENPVKYAMGHGFGYDTDADLIAGFEDKFDITVVEAYGITPTSSHGITNYPDERKLGSIGQPLPHIDVKIVDEHDWEVPTGETGEIVIQTTRPNTIARGFYNNPELFSDVFRNQYLHTNDIGYKDEEGYIFFVANKNNSIQLGRVGGRISSLEIESVIDAHPDVANSVVLGVENDMGDEAIKAVVIPRSGATLRPVEVSKHCEQQLMYQKLPRYIEIREDLPRTSTGKVPEEELRDTRIENGVWDRESGYELNR